MNIEIFGKAGCAKCDAAKKIIGTEMKKEFTYHDLGTPDGVAEYVMRGFDAAFRMRVPVISVDGQGYDVIGKAVEAIRGKSQG